VISDVHPPITAVRDVVARALQEDLEPLGDLSGSLLGVDRYGEGAFVSRADGVLAGRLCAVETFAAVDPTVRVEFVTDDGEEVEQGQRLGTVAGPLPSILAAERTALNMLGHLSGVASLTRRYVRTARGLVRILDTRKTHPGLRALEKAAVRAGGGANHRGSLSDGIMLKDNHLAVLGISEGVRRARVRWPGRPVHVECDSIPQVEQALEAGAERVMLDNMSPAEVAEAVATVDGRCEVEVTGGIDLRNLVAYAEAGPSFISVGALTHSAPALDISLDIDSGLLAGT
jgi:nicotinate-nucleotide pyrophosphorylase (carboxylating)